MKPSREQVEAYCTERANGIDAGRFIDHYEANGWRVGKSAMKDWRATVRKWERNERADPAAAAPTPTLADLASQYEPPSDLNRHYVPRRA